MLSNLIRSILIFHLCLVFSLVLFRTSDPFAGELYRLKAQKLIYEAVQNNRILFTALPKLEQERIFSSYAELLAKGQSSFGHKLRRSINIVLFELFFYERLWIFCSILLPLMLLLGVDGSLSAIWILPLIASVWAIADLRQKEALPLSLEYKLFPSEAYLMTNYSAAELAPSWREQQLQLTEAWQRYLIHEWAAELPEESSERSAKQLERGQFAFNLERTRRFPPIEARFDQPTKLSPILWALFLCWHLVFASISILSRNKSPQSELEKLSCFFMSKFSK